MYKCTRFLKVMIFKNIQIIYISLNYVLTSCEELNN
jgi:hypothetical protein